MGNYNLSFFQQKFQFLKKELIIIVGSIDWLIAIDSFYLELIIQVI